MREGETRCETRCDKGGDGTDLVEGVDFEAPCSPLVGAAVEVVADGEGVLDDDFEGGGGAHLWEKVGEGERR